MLLKNKSLKEVWLLIIWSTFILALEFVSSPQVNASTTATLRIDISEDTYTAEGEPTKVFGNEKNLMLGYDSKSGKLRTRPYFKYDLQPLVESGISADSITEATLNIYQWAVYNPSPYTVALYSITENWNENSLTWQNSPDEKFEHNGGRILDIKGFRSIVITDLIKSQLADINQFYGLAIHNGVETNKGGDFWSRTCTLGEEPVCVAGNEPFIEITYVVNTPPIPTELISPTAEFQTNKREIEFKWSNAIDLEGDEIFYILEIASDPEFQEIMFSSDWITETTFTQLFDTDGIFYWHVRTKDQYTSYIDTSVSSAQTLEIDTTPPQTPIILPEPSYTYGNSNVIKWHHNATNEPNQVKFTAQQWQATDQEANPIITQEIETCNFDVTFSNLQNGHYFYRVKAIDFLGNESGWSEITSSRQDLTNPTIKSFNTSLDYISPYNSPGIQDYTIINFTIDDATLKEWALTIENSAQTTIYSRNDLSTGNISVAWPDLQSSVTIPDGTYFAYIEATDLVGLTQVSNAIRIVVDSKSPKKQRFIKPENNFLIQTKVLYIEIEAEELAENTVYLNGNVIYNSKKSDLKLTTDKIVDGKNLLFVKSVDFAGNSAESEMDFYVSQTNPPTFLPESFTEGSFAEILGVSTNSSQIGTIDQYIPDLSEVPVMWKTKKTTEKGIPQCIYKYQSTFKTLKREECDVTVPSLDNVLNREISYRNYEILMNGGFSYQQYLIIKEYKCKARSIWSPKSWIKCQEELVKTTPFYVNTKAYMFAVIDSERPKATSTVADNSQQYQYTTSLEVKKDYADKKIQTIASVYFSKMIDESKKIYLDFSQNSTTSNALTIPKKAYIPYSNNISKPLKWPFAGIVGVTQWHGNTAFQTPHRGIDFGVVKQSIYAPADGIVTFAGQEGNKKDCLNGGKVLKIKH